MEDRRPSKLKLLLRIVLAGIILYAAAYAVFTLVSIKPARLTILFTHDLHSNLAPYLLPADDGGAIEAGGYARLAAAINAERRGREDKVLVVDGGDFSMGTFFHAIRSTHSPELVTMGLMGYDATTFGNHEFEFGPQHLAQALLAAKSLSQGRLPAIVASNTVVDAQATELVDLRRAYAEYPVLPYLVTKRAGLKIGIFGLMGKDAAIYSPEAGPVVFSDPIAAAARTVDTLRNKEKVDLVICLSHCGTWADKKISEDEILAGSVPGIDLIISGHTHSILDPFIKAGNTYIVSCGAYGRYLGRLVLVRNPDRTFSDLDYKLIPVTSALPEEPQIADLVKSLEKDIDREYLGQFGYHYGQALAEIDFSLPEPDWDKCYDRQKCLNSGLGDLVTDAFIYAVKKAEGAGYRDISLAFEGFGQIRVPLAKGTLSVNDSFRLLALGIGADGFAGSGLVTFWLNGSEIKKIFELEATLAAAKYDMHLQVTGMSFSYDPGGPPFARVRQVEVLGADGQWQPLEDNRLYRVCTSWKVVLMRKGIEQISGGKLVFIPKDEAGNPIEDMQTARVFINSLELKEWLALAMYLESFPAGSGSLPKVPDRYRKARDNITITK